MDLPDYGADKDSVAVITVQTLQHCVCMRELRCGSGAEGIALLAAVSQGPEHCKKRICVG